MPTKPIVSMTACLASFASLSTAAQIHVFVDDDAPPGGDGLSWATARNDLRDAVQFSESLGLNRGEIRIAGGTYLDDAGGPLIIPIQDRAPHLQLLGGFNGLADPLNPDVRDAEINKTHLLGVTSGIAIRAVGDGGQFADFEAPVSSIRIGDGLSLSGLSFSNDQAVSIEATNDAPVIIEDCRFVGCETDRAGGAIYALGARLAVRRSVFESCEAAGSGGAIDLGLGDLFVSESGFRGNRSTDGGGAINASGDTVAIEFSRFETNSVSGSFGSGGAVYLSAGAAGSGIRNTEFVGNQATWFGGAVIGFGRVVVADSQFVGNRSGTPGENGGGSAIAFGDRLPGGTNAWIARCDFNTNTAFGAGAVTASFDDQRLTIEDSVFRQNEADQPGSAIHVGPTNSAEPMVRVFRTRFESNTNTAIHAEGGLLVQDSEFSSNSGEKGGAILVDSSATITSSAFTQNSATDGGAIYGPAAIDRSTFFENHAEERGGALAMVADVSQSSLNSNSAGLEGGAIYGVERGSRLLVTENTADRKASIAELTGPLEDSRVTGGIQRDPLSLFGTAVHAGSGAHIRRGVFDAGEGPLGTAISFGSSEVQTQLLDSLVLGGVWTNFGSIVKIEGCSLFGLVQSFGTLRAGNGSEVFVVSTLIAGDIPITANNNTAVALSFVAVPAGLDAVNVSPPTELSILGPVLEGTPGLSDPDGPDDDPATLSDNDYSPMPGSPLIDAGFGFGLDASRRTDSAGKPRVVDDPGLPNTGAGNSPIDIGAFEFQGITCLPDVNGDGRVGSEDFFAWVNAFGAGDPRADQNRDGAITSEDFFAWVSNFNAGC